jgi:hypothetical protein
MPDRDASAAHWHGSTSSGFGQVSLAGLDDAVMGRTPPRLASQPIRCSGLPPASRASAQTARFPGRFGVLRWR